MLPRFLPLGLLMSLVTAPSVLGQLTSGYPATTSLPLAFEVGYLGSLRYPGFSVGIGWPLRHKEVFQGRPDHSPVLRRTAQGVLTAQLSYYHHPRYHDYWRISVGYQWRRTKATGWFVDVSPQVGVSRTFTGATVYRVTADNRVQKVSLAGDWFASGLIAFSVGKQLAIRRGVFSPVGIYLRPSLLVLLPYNQFLYGRPALEVGTRLTFGQGPRVRARLITRYKH
jgi:hypothetical protein